ncbi:hypothetical protein C8R44DRAFT_883468 [Mycena epipterygia]|nr:hypothetical protein C8R44DRAFT_883468 [Mycena epipterygia]
MKVVSACNATRDLALLAPAVGGSELIDFGHHLFAQITHLEILGWDNDSQIRVKAEELILIPRLTHLGFHGKDGRPSLCARILDHCALLEVLAIICPSKTHLNVIAPNYGALAADPRFVVLVVGSRVSNWEAGACGHKDYWVRADEIVEGRRAGANKGDVANL